MMLYRGRLRFLVEVHQAESISHLGEFFGAGGEGEAVAHDEVGFGKWDLSQF
jgi:hypothetical protein